MPIGELKSVGPWAFTISDRLIFFGRQFILRNEDLPLLIAIYATLAFFFIGSLSAKASNLFAPLGLAMGATLVASMAVRPFLYAALFIEVAILIGVPFLSSPGHLVQRSVLRYLTFLSFGFPFMLFAGWLLSQLGSDLTDPGEILPELVFLGIGFVFLLAIFPLNSWIPMLMESVHPYPPALLLTIFPMIVIALLLRFIGSYSWLLDFDVISFLGLLMVATGGLWAIFQRDLGRIFGFAVTIEIGRSLLAISQPDGEWIYSAMLFPRLLTLGLWALALSLLRTQFDNLRFRSVQGIGFHYPILATCLIIANISFAGFPLLASFPVIFSLLEQLAQDSMSLALWALLGSVGLLIGGFKTMAVFLRGSDDLPEIVEIDRMSNVLLLMGLIAIVIIGLFPQSLQPLL
jgi:NADH:ubiquinone oxidoreductase subunit 2 (subunit N)